MRGLIPAIGALAAFATASAFAEIVVYPDDPRAGETVVVMSSIDNLGLGAGRAATSSRATLLGTEITTTLATTANASPSRPFAFNFATGAVDTTTAGFHNIYLRSDLAGSPPILKGSFTVATNPDGFSRPAYTGLTANWFNPQDSGWGVNLIQGGDGKQLFAIWFDYGLGFPETTTSSFGAEVGQGWRVMSSGHWITPNVFRGALYETVDGTGAGDGPPLLARLIPVGYMTLTFFSSDEMEFKAVFRGGSTSFREYSRTQVLRRLVF
ncbi:hypothetical protein BWI17_17045 [Betaproteobacteria bacterium GR16-43]|nr:hypothetical protein BWI17_17045 [Betaproteobacteria bacterium GR16-43]